MSSAAIPTVKNPSTRIIGDDVVQMIVRNSCPETTIRHICELVARHRDGLRAEFEPVDGVATQRKASPLGGRQRSIPVRDGKNKPAGLLHIHAETHCVDSNLDCEIIRHVVQLIELVIARKDDRDAARREREKVYVALQRTSDGIVTTDAKGIIDYINPIAEELLQTSLRSAVGCTAHTMLVFEDKATGRRLDNPLSMCLLAGRPVAIDENAILGCGGGAQVPVHGSAAPLQNDAGQIIGSVLVFHDVSTSSRIASQLAYQASHDPLTGLINRSEFEKRVVNCIATRANLAGSCGLLQIDIDQLKVVNDTHGHVVGDELLRRVAEVIRRNLRNEDTLARISGDEFGALIRDCERDEILAIAESVRADVEAFRFEWQGSVAHVQCSIGVVIADEDNADVSTLLAHADVACYAAKENGRNQISLYSNGGHARRHEEMKCVSRITHALEERRFELHFQPILALSRAAAAEPKHYEILLRMRDPQGRLVPPCDFVPAAERYNLMPKLDCWVIRKVCEQHVDRGKAEATCTFAVNVSGRSLCDHRFLDFVQGELKRHALPAGAICFEITETAAISDLPRAVFFIKSMRQLGCKFALDDFGSGLSSFAYLKQMPVNILKIDGHFVRDMLADKVDICTVQAISQVARSVGIETVAEQVESGAVLDKLREIGVDYAQGYHIARPVPMAEFDLSRRYG